jgi:hypothetical protein
MSTRADPGRALALMRSGLVGLTVVAIVGIAFELASQRHWNGVVQLIPWAALAMLAVAVALLAVSDRPVLTTVVRLLAAGVVVVSLFGIVEHVLVNYDAGAVDPSFGDGWASLPATTRWWYAASATVGQSPPLAPGMLGQAALLLLLATVGRPRAGRTEPIRHLGDGRSGAAVRPGRLPDVHRDQGLGSAARRRSGPGRLRRQPTQQEPPRPVREPNAAPIGMARPLPGSVDTS